MNITQKLLRGAAIGIGGVALAAGAWTAAAAPWTPTETTVPALSSAEKADLVFSRDEERMARDLYTAIAAQYGGALPFSAVATSEQRHFDSVGVLLTRYGVDDPASGKATGVYADASIQKLYDSLLAQSKTSLTEAYKVGIAVENRDIADLRDAIETSAKSDVDRVYMNLLAGSDSHLRAFTNASEGIVPTAAPRQTQAGATPSPGRYGPGTGVGAGMGRAGQGGYGPGNGTGVCVAAS